MSLQQIALARARPSSLVYRAHPSSSFRVSRGSVIPRAFVSDVSKYLAEAAAQIFHPTDESDVPWERSAEPFSGKISHHEEIDRLRQLRDVVKSARKSLEGCTDPDASNYDPAAVTDDGSCIYTAEQLSGSGSVSLQEFVRTSLDRVFGHNFVGDETEPKKYFSIGYSARGRTQRELRRDIDRLRRFEQVVSEAIESSETENAK